MLNERKNILFLDMDGVLNSNFLIQQWLDNKYKQLQEETNYNENLQIELSDKVIKLFQQQFKYGKQLIFEELSERLRQIQEHCNLKLVWSTSWRLVNPYKDNIYNARAMLQRRGLIGTSLMDYTPNFGRLSYYGSQCRCNEILSFVKNNKFGITFQDKLAAIDDLNLFELEEFGIKFFNTEIKFGLTEKIKNEMIQFYNKD